MSTNSFRRFTKRLIIGSNVLVALLFLIGCYSSWFNPKYFWFTGLLTLASFYLLLVLLGFIFFWLFIKPGMIFISLITLALAWNPLQHLVQLRLSPNFTREKHPSNLRAMSWNVELFDILEYKTHPERKLEMINIINEHQPDVACFQEMVGSDRIPGAINFVPDFAKSLDMPYYHYSYNPKLDFDGNHHFGIITFSKYPIISKHTISYAPNDYNSIFQYIDIVKGPDTFRVFNLHLQSLKFSNENLYYIEKPALKDEEDIEKTKNVLSKLKKGFLKRKVQSIRIKESINKSPYPVIVCGDLNDVPNSYAYNTIGRGLKNAYTEKGTGIGRTYSGITPTLRIDDIFVDKRCNVEQFVRIKKKISDHFPIIADVYYTKE